MAATVFKCQPINIIKIRIINFFLLLASLGNLCFIQEVIICIIIFVLQFLMFSFCLICDHCTYILLRFSISYSYPVAFQFFSTSFLAVFTYVSLKMNFHYYYYVFFKPTEFAFASNIFCIFN